MSNDRTGQRYKSRAGKVWRVARRSFGGWALVSDWPCPYYLSNGGGTKGLVRSDAALDRDWERVS